MQSFNSLLVSVVRVHFAFSPYGAERYGVLSWWGVPNGTIVVLSLKDPTCVSLLAFVEVDPRNPDPQGVKF